MLLKMMDNSDIFDSMFLVDVTDDAGESIQTLSFSRSPTVLLNFAANRFTRAAARHYQAKFGIGAMDWRMLVMLTRRPGATITETSNTIGIDKGAVSRAVARLAEKGLVEKGELHSNGRSRGWWLTAQGSAMHAQILKEALARQRVLLDGYSEEEIKAFCNMLSRFLDNLSILTDRDNS